MSEQQNDEQVKVEASAETAPENTKEKAAKKAESVPKVKFFPVKLLKNYRPLGPFKVAEEDGLRDPTDEELAKVPAGNVVHLPIEEAKSIVGKKIAERNDAIA